MDGAQLRKMFYKMRDCIKCGECERVEHHVHEIIDDILEF